MSRMEIMARLRATAAAKRPIVGCGAGTGLTAKMAEVGGADLVVVYNSGRFRMAGRGSLAGLMPYADANAVVLDMAREIATVVEDVPLIAGVCASHPFLNKQSHYEKLVQLGFSGIQNFPTVGLIDGTFRQHLEATGMGYDTEIEAIRFARDRGLFTVPYVFDEEQARAMADAGADVIVVHVGLTAGGSIGARDVDSSEAAIEHVLRLARAAREIVAEMLVLFHGGPFNEPGPVAEGLARMPGVHGFLGASSIERLPTERAIQAQVEMLKGATLG